MKHLYILIILFSAISLKGFAQETIDISGEWQFRIDREDTGVKEQWFKQSSDDMIRLPGSMAENLKGDDVTLHTPWTGSLYDSSYFFNPAMEKFRREGNIMLPFFLTPLKHYVGVAWYNKEIIIPENKAGKRIILYLERPHIETTLWVNNQKAGSRNSLCAPHIYDITSLVKPGKCNLSIRIDNRIKDINVGPDSHSITDQTQGNWNGIAGRMELITTPTVFFHDIRIYPDLTNKKATIKMAVRSLSKSRADVRISLSAKSFNSDREHTVPTISESFTVKGGELLCEMDLLFDDGMLTWDEFDPALYQLTAELVYGDKKDTRQVRFGMREFTIKGKWFYVNGNKTMLRGTVENCCFPLTGYAPMDVEAWERVFRICRNFGLNHIRFHSYCPPEAAFMAADKVGFYLQPEGPSWPNHGPRLGVGQPIDSYLMEETIRLTEAYGNYASFCMLACGNEPAGNWVPWVTQFVEYWQKTDPRRVYTGASVGNSWAWQPRNPYHVKAGARGLSWADERPESLSDYRERIDTVQQPYVSHETGQWCAFPNFSEIRKYTGVNKARNFEIFKELLSDNYMDGKGYDFLMASGKLQALCYKHEIEKTLRTPGYAGFQLLSLNDYSGQGTALVGLLDVFFEEKGYIDAEQMRRFCNSTVPLARIPKFVYTNDEVFRADIEVAHFHKKPLIDARVTYTIRDAYGKVWGKGLIGRKDVPIGNCFSLGKVHFPLQAVTEARKLNLEVRIEGTDFVNDWDFWVYPATIAITEKNLVYVTDTLDNKAIDRLKEGGKVLITAAGKISYGKEIVQHFTPVFWNTSWFKMRPPHTTGIWVNEYHPLFRNFPTEYHSNLQWWELLNKSQVMQFSEFPAGFQPLVQSIDTWFISRKIGPLFEANVLNGKLMMTSMDLTSDPDNRIVARQLYKAILDYMDSDKFRPEYAVPLKQIQDLFTQTAPKTNTFTRDAPDELKTAAQAQPPTDFPWTKDTGAKRFPGGKEFSVAHFGAEPDSSVLNTRAIQAAIDACHLAGGGIVTFPPGYYLTGALFVKSGVNLHIGKGVTLLADTNLSHYPEIPTRVAGIEMVWPAAVLNIMDAENAAVSGNGIIDCRGKTSWDTYWKMRKVYEEKGLRWIVDYDCKRIRGILVSNSSDVTLKDFTLMRSGFWAIQILYSRHCTADGLIVDNNIGGHGPSTDGIDIDSSSYIRVENCDIDCNDDNICLKAGRDADGLRVNRPTEYILIRNCIARKGAGLITCGSETSGGIRHVLGHNLKAYGTSAVLRLKSAMNRGGFVEHIYMRDVEADSVGHVLAADLNWNPSYSYSLLPDEYRGQELPPHWQVMLTPVEPKEKGYPRFRHIYLSDVKAANVQSFISASGRDHSLKLEHFGLFNIEAEAATAGTVRFAEHFVLKNILLKTADNSIITIKNDSQEVLR